KIGSEKRALSWLVDHRLAGRRVKFRNDIVAGFAAHEDAAHRPRVPDAGRAAAADFLCRRKVSKIRSMTLARVDDQASRGAPGCQQCSVWFNSTTKLRYVVPEHFAETAGFQEVTLHVDDQQRGQS